MHYPVRCPKLLYSDDHQDDEQQHLCSAHDTPSDEGVTPVTHVFQPCCGLPSVGYVRSCIGTQQQPCCSCQRSHFNDKYQHFCTQQQLTSCQKQHQCHYQQQSTFQEQQQEQQQQHQYNHLHHQCSCQEQQQQHQHHHHQQDSFQEHQQHHQEHSCFHNGRLHTLEHKTQQQQNYCLQELMYQQGHQQYCLCYSNHNVTGSCHASHNVIGPCHSHNIADSCHTRHKVNSLCQTNHNVTSPFQYNCKKARSYSATRNMNTYKHFDKHSCSQPPATTPSATHGPDFNSNNVYESKYQNNDTGKVHVNLLNEDVNYGNHSLEVTCNIYSRLRISPKDESSVLQRLSTQGLPTSGWYYGRLTWQEAELKLRCSDVGSFLVRDSSDPMYSFSLSVQTPRGPTSVRIQQDYRGLSLDSDPSTPAGHHACLHHLLQHYIKLTKFRNPAGVSDSYTKTGEIEYRENVWLDSSGAVVATISLSNSYRKEPGTLKHLARLVVNENIKVCDIRNLPSNLVEYLERYPFWC